jgi:hypothetical protein
VAWKIIKERLDILVETFAYLGKEPGLGALAKLAQRLHSMSQDVGQRLAERTAPGGRVSAARPSSRQSGSPTTPSTGSPPVQRLLAFADRGKLGLDRAVGALDPHSRCEASGSAR